MKKQQKLGEQSQLLNLLVLRTVIRSTKIVLQEKQRQRLFQQQVIIPMRSRTVQMLPAPKRVALPIPALSAEIPTQRKQTLWNIPMRKQTRKMLHVLKKAIQNIPALSVEIPIQKILLLQDMMMVSGVLSRKRLLFQVVQKN